MEPVVGRWLNNGPFSLVAGYWLDQTANAMDPPTLTTNDQRLKTND
jgi:hypothetical protein